MLLPLKPICEEKNIRADGTSIIYIQYCYSTKKRTTLNTELAIPPAFWNESKLIVAKNLPAKYGSSGALNEKLKHLYRLAEDLVLLAEKNNIIDKIRFVKEVFSPTLNLQSLAEDHDKLRSYVNPKPGTNKDIYFQLDEYVKVKTGKVSNSTISIYKNLGEQLKQFEVYRNLPITFQSLDFDFIDRFIHFLTFEYIQKRRKKIVKGLKRNSIHKAVKQLRLFVKDRIKRKIINPIDLSEFKSPEEEADAIYLTTDEIALIYNLDLTPYPYLIPFRNRFVFACLTGLRFSDFSVINRNDHRNGFLYKKQEKSDHWVAIPLREEAKILLEEIFKDGLDISNVDFNENIKIIGKLAGLNQLITFSYKKGNIDVKETKAKCDWITSHTCRRSFCTNEFLAGTPVKLIMKISGHKTEKDFYKYIRITPEEAAIIIKKLWEERNGMHAFNIGLHTAV